MTVLRKLSGDCELEGLRELLLREMLIIGLNDKKLQDYLLRESNLNLKKTVEICRIVEVTPSQAITAINPDYNNHFAKCCNIKKVGYVQQISG